MHTASDFFQKFNSEYCQIFLTKILQIIILTISIQHFSPFGTKLKQCCVLSSQREREASVYILEVVIPLKCQTVAG